jgi:MoxR-like ATPase
LIYDFILDVNCKTIKEWEDLDAIVFETRAMKCLNKMIEEEGIVTVIGSPGCGKTTAIHHVALRLNKEQLYDVVPAVYPSDIRDYYDPERKQVFVFDDVSMFSSVYVFLSIEILEQIQQCGNFFVFH